MIEEINHNDQRLAIIISKRFNKPGINFLTPNNLSQQLAFMNYPAGKLIKPHIHNHIAREVQFTQEVIILKKGKLRVDFYTDQQQFLENRILESGDVLMLIAGGHGFEVLEEVEMIEVKQGPYLGEHDKTCFEGLTSAKPNRVRL
jgi:mannose-6-phosphate isomerase-like protein (cupin superfamily)